MRMLAVYHKTEAARFVSHLDVQRTLHRVFRRAKLPLAYSSGFNPHPELSFASALATGSTSDAEWFEVELEGEVSPNEFLERVNAAVPRGFFLSDAAEMPANVKTLAALTRAADYSVSIQLDRSVSADELKSALDIMLSGEIIMNKKTKSGVKPVDIRPEIIKVHTEYIEGNELRLRVIGKLQSDGGLRTELFVAALLERLAAHGTFKAHRNAMYFESNGFLPRVPET